MDDRKYKLISHLGIVEVIDNPFCVESKVRNLETNTTDLEKQIAELEQQVQDTENALTGAIDCIEKMKCCGNCENEENQELSSKCEYCIRYENNENEGGCYSDNWKHRVDG